MRQTLPRPLDRVYKIRYPGGAVERTFYNNLGQHDKTVDPEDVTTIFAYNEQGQLN